jgi:hypothetical protein
MKTSELEKERKDTERSIAALREKIRLLKKRLAYEEDAYACFLRAIEDHVRLDDEIRYK